MDRAIRLTHLLEQAGVLFREIAQLVGLYYQELEKSGVPPDQAALLARDVQRQLLEQQLDSELDTPLE